MWVPPLSPASTSSGVTDSCCRDLSRPHGGAGGLVVGSGTRGVECCVVGRRQRLFMNRSMSSAGRPRPYQVASGSLARNRSPVGGSGASRTSQRQLPSHYPRLVPPIPPPGTELKDLLPPSDKTGFPEHACRALTGLVTSSLGPVSRGSERQVLGGVQAMLTHLTCQGSNKRVGVGVWVRVGILPWTR